MLCVMANDSLTHVSIWLDDESSSDGGLRQAIDWAGRLGLPLRVVVTSTRFAKHAITEAEQANVAAVSQREATPIVEKIKSWGLACAQRGIMMETTFWVGETEVGIDQFLRPRGLCIIEHNHREEARGQLLERSLRRRDVVLALTPPNNKLLSRVLVLNDPLEPESCFLETAARLCGALGVQPLVLTIAASEEDALLKQRFAEGICSSLHVAGDFDSVVSHDARLAVARVAQWRKCSHVFFERPKNGPPLPRRQRFGADAFHDLRELSGLVTLVALPEALLLDFPYKVRESSAGRLSRLAPAYVGGPA
jgi:hypothetical protein